MGAFVVVLREAFEACLVLSLIFAFLTRTGQREQHARTIWAGVAAAVGTSVVAGGILFAALGEVEGTGRQVFEGIAMLVACVVLTWMVFWMRKQARTIGGHLRAQVGEAVAAGGGTALAAVAFVGVAREGLETALFLFVSVGDDGVLRTLLGGALGLVAAIAAGVAFYRGSLKLDLRRFFQVTGLLIVALGAYLLFGGLHELAEAGGGEALDVLGVAGAIAFAAGFGWLYLRSPRRRDAAAERA
jgi:high-affinity iron transporter